MSKFDSELDAILYEMTLDGAETKAYSDGSAVTLVDNIIPEGYPFTDWTPQRLERLSAEQRAKAKTIRAAILFERSDGIVEVKTFTDNASAEQAFYKYPDGDNEG